MKLIDIDCCNLSVGQSKNTRMVSDVGAITGHLKVLGNGELYIFWGALFEFDDGERSINGFWRRIEGLRRFVYLKGKCIILTMDENPDDEDFGCCYNFS